MNRFSQKVIIVSRNLDGFSFNWRIMDDLPISPNFLPAKLSCYMVVGIDPKVLRIYTHFIQETYKNALVQL